jgi:hypothetical protein
MRNTMAYLSANRPYASDPAVVARAVSAAAATTATAFRIPTREAAAAIIELRRQHTDAGWRAFVSTDSFTTTYRPPADLET